MGSYWNHKGKYQKEYDAMRDRLVPIEGKAPTPYGEVLRVMGNLYYDHYNNGDWNDLQKEKMFLVSWAQNNASQNVLNATWDFRGGHATDDEYDLVADAVIEWVMKQEKAHQDYQI